jgi:Rhodopirellula transposase DDE domain
MAVTHDDDRLATKLAEIRPYLDELQWRLLLGAEARAIGIGHHGGGVQRVARAAKVSPDTVSRGVREVDQGLDLGNRVRRPGAGRPGITETDPAAVAELEKLVAPETRGDPMRPLRWTTASTAKLAEVMTGLGHPMGPRTVAKLLKEVLGYSLQANAKTIEGGRHPDRDGQFRYINDQLAGCLSVGEPVISIDAKKKELVGNFKNSGAQWRPAGDPEQVNVYDFKGELGKVTPYGIYDVAANTGWVNVGTDRDTAQFAVESIRRWWNSAGTRAYPQATKLMITADCGGSNSYRTRLWKAELAKLATELGIEITVCHLPPGTSKWNKIEHRLFSHISMNWRGRPLTSHEVVVESISATTTSTGLSVQAELDPGSYPTGIKVSDKEMKALREHQIDPHDYHGEWNYTIKPERSRHAREGKG